MVHRKPTTFLKESHHLGIKGAERVQEEKRSLVSQSFLQKKIKLGGFLQLFNGENDTIKLLRVVDKSKAASTLVARTFSLEVTM